MIRCLLIALLACPSCLAAQNMADTAAFDRDGTRAVEVWAGLSTGSPSMGVFGLVTGQHIALTAARFRRRIALRRSYAVDYTFDVLPLAVLSPPMEHSADPTKTVPCGTYTVCMGDKWERSKSLASGFGFNPVGISMVYRRFRWFQPLLGANGGVLWFDRPVPTSLSTKFNFTAAIEAGAQCLDDQGRGVVFMYRLHHLSNAGMGRDNLALASHVFSIGARWRRSSGGR